RVGIDDNFFRLGGDSILSIQLVSRIRKAGLLLTPRDVFQQQTVAALAAVAKIQDEIAQPAWDEAAAIGEVSATPIMRSFLERGGPIRQFHQSILLRVPERLSASDLAGSLQAVVDAHDALRMRMEHGHLSIPPRG